MKNWPKSKITGAKIAWLKLRRNQISTPYFIYQIDRSNKINIIRNFENETPIHKSATHAISKTGQKSQIRIPRELYQKFGTSRISTIHRVSFTFLK